MINAYEHMLVCLSEECIEVSKEIHKVLRFGPDDKLTMDPLGPRGTEGPTAMAKVLTELNQLYAMVELMEKKGFLPANWQDAAVRKRKKVRVAQYMWYALQVGSVEGYPFKSVPGLKSRKKKET
jgi:hypothetical protein